MSDHWYNAVAPTTEGKAGLGWCGVVPDEVRHEWRNDATVGTWILYSPVWHKVWSWYAVMMITLRDVEGQERAPFKHFPEAAYEVLVVALDPEHEPPHPHRIGLEQLHWLTPVNQCVQFGDPGGDDAAREILGLIIAAIVKGQLNPDDDARARFTQVVQTTAQHYIEGRH